MREKVWIFFRRGYLRVRASVQVRPPDNAARDCAQFCAHHHTLLSATECRPYASKRPRAWHL